MNSQPPAVKKFERENGVAEYHVLAAEGWDDCGSLARFIVKHFGADVISQQDGICSREWVLRVGPTDLHLRHHEDIGNFFYADAATPEGDELLNRIAAELGARLSRQE